MIAVGVGVAPMIQTLRALLRDFSAGGRAHGLPMRIVLLYGVVERPDALPTLQHR
jgi:NAD(P)H-flavin reductase